VDDLIAWREIPEMLGESAYRRLAGGPDLFDDLAGQVPRVEVGRSSNDGGEVLDSGQ
jgi:hypothetical protein